jgi:PAS domain S-box-containing protein
MSYKARILIVDDDPRMCDSLKTLLSGYGYEVHTANGAVACMDYLSRWAFDLVLLDVVMPEADGFDVMEHIYHESPDTLVIIMTGHASMSSAIQALRKGAYDYLRKPFEAEELLTTIKNALENNMLKRDRKRIEKTLRKRLAYEKMLNDISSQAISANDMDEFQENCLEIMGRVLDVSRIYIFEHSHETDTMNNVFEWVARGITPQMNNLQGISSSATPWWMDMMKNNRIINYRDIEDIPGEQEKKILRPQQIKSVLVVPLFIQRRYYGFMGFDECRNHREWSPEDVEILRTISQLVTGTLERKHTEGALRQSDNQKRAILDASIDRIRLVDRDMRIIWANRTTTRELGVTPEDIKGRVCYELLYARDTPCPGCPTLKTLKTGVTEHAVMRHHKVLGVEGESHWENYAVPIKDESGKIVSLIQIARNITERVRAEKEKKALEAQLLQARKMEAIGTLAGGIAHDFNNLLMGILGNASLMLLGMDTTHPHHEKLKSIEQYVMNGAELTRQLLGLARAGKYDVKPTNVNDIIEKSSEMFGRTRKGITIHRKLWPDIWPVEIDRAQVEQVFLNFYLNAWQSMPGGGNLYLQTENVELDERYTKAFGMEPGRFVKISVMDTGMGMDKATKERIFEPFFTTKEIGRGTGLGLASAYGIIKNHGGIIEVHSEKGHGSTFNIYLPACDKMFEREKRGSPGEILKGQGTILLVDDEEMILQVGKEMLERLGYNVLMAKGGVEALKIYRMNQHRVHLVILDMIMPDMGGSETFEKLKGINPEVRVILSSGYSLEDQALEIMERGCDGFIQKPFNINDLSKHLRLILEGHQA